MSGKRYTTYFRGFQTNEGALDVNDAIKIFRDYDGRVATLVLAHPDAVLKGDTSLVVVDKIPGHRTLYLTDQATVEEWGGTKWADKESVK